MGKSLYSFLDKNEYSSCLCLSLFLESLVSVPFFKNFLSSWQMSLMLRWFWANSIWYFVTLLFTTILRGTGEGVKDKGEGGGEGKGDETADSDVEGGVRGDGEGGAQGDREGGAEGDGDGEGGPNS